MNFLKKHWPEMLLGLMIALYVGYFSYFSLLRYQTLYSHYFDLGIMNQTVHNTFMSLKTGDLSRFLEMTNPHGFDQVKRMAVHNDIFLALLAPFYFIFSGPETLLVIQTIAVALGSIAVFCIGKIVFYSNKNARAISLFFAFAYLMYPPLQRANQFDFHAVVFATPLLLFMYYFYLKKKYVFSLLCVMGALLTKEQVGLTAAFFGIYTIVAESLKHKAESSRLKVERKTNGFLFGGIIIFISIGWFVLSMTKIIPYFRSGAHFALGYFGDIGDSPINVFLGLIKNPLIVFRYIFKKDAIEYLLSTFAPLGFLSLFSPLHLLIAVPELAINLLSSSGAMRNIYFHYSAVITPFIFISALYGTLHIQNIFKKIHTITPIIVGIGLVLVLYFSITESPLPYSYRKEVLPFTSPSPWRFEALIWKNKLADDSIKVMTTGKMGPLFSSRRYFYNFSERYDLADYVVLYQDDIYNGYESENLIVAYNKLVKDPRFITIYSNNTFEVYKKL